MANTCTVLRRIENISQLVANFLTIPTSFTPVNATNLFNEISLLIGSIRELPLAQGIKDDIINRLIQAQNLLIGSNVVDTTTRLLAVLQIIQVVVLKVNNHPVACTPGFTIAHPSNVFSTSCNLCR